MKVLVIEDDQTAAGYIVAGLADAGHEAMVVGDGGSGLARLLAEPHDVVVLDRMLPRLEGLPLIKALRAAGNTTPVLFLTAIGGLDDRIEGLDAGGDDYLVKPFAFSELMARLHALVRRRPVGSGPNSLRVADIELDLVKRICQRGGTPIELLPREFELLEFLMRNEGRVVTRSMLLEQVWDFHFDPHTSVVETQISRLRAKIDKPFDRQLLRTIRSTGYCLNG